MRYVILKKYEHTNLHQKKNFKGASTNRWHEGVNVLNVKETMLKNCFIHCSFTTQSQTFE